MRKGAMEGSPVKATTQQGSADVDAPCAPAPDVHPSYDLAPFFVPIPGDVRGREVFLKVTVSLAFRDRVPSDEIARKNFMLRNTITDILLSKRLSDLRSIEGKVALKQEIRNVINLRLTRGTVDTVYFEEFFIL
jgi:flagellar basal body-associated protein FliL